MYSNYDIQNVYSVVLYTFETNDCCALFLCNHRASSSTTMTCIALCSATATHAIEQCQPLQAFLAAKLILSVNCITKRRECPPCTVWLCACVCMCRGSEPDTTTIRCLWCRHRYSSPCQYSCTAQSIQYAALQPKSISHGHNRLVHAPFFHHLLLFTFYVQCDGALISTPSRFIHFFSLLFFCIGKHRQHELKSRTPWNIDGERIRKTMI